ncbi:MAG: triose-phosphate isomerase [Flavobacteriales bacterium]
MRKRYVIGNWKMNHDANASLELYTELKTKILYSAHKIVVVAPPSVFLAKFADSCSKELKLSAQNVYFENNGAFTGEVSASMLASLNVEYCLVGHSERRNLFNEIEAQLSKKVDALLANKITPVYCCGETMEEREGKRHKEVLNQQIEEGLFHLNSQSFSQVIIAYEPVWAIGTGLTATTQQVEEIHAYIRDMVKGKYGSDVAENLSILYGGSCKPENAAELFACKNVDGGLIGGAALKADSFLAIVNAL